jgi:hypothetical protein
VTRPSSDEKRQRAAAFPPASATSSTKGALDVVWDSPFDRLCYLVSATDLARKHRLRYDALMTELITGTGCTEDEVLAHGLKVRGLLFFAEDRLARQGALATLVGKERHPYRLACVTPEF